MTELIVPSAEIAEKFPILDPDSRIGKAMRTNLQGEATNIGDLINIKVPGQGATNWVYDSASGEQVEAELHGIPVALVKQGAIWPYENPGDNRPYLVSHDLLVGHRFGDDPGDLDVDHIESCKNDDGTYRWPELSYTQWGSDPKGGRGKRAKESRRLFLLQSGCPFPSVVDIPPSSLKALRQFLMQLPAGFNQCVITLGLKRIEKSGDRPAYSEITFRCDGTLSDSDADIIQNLYTTPLTEQATQPPRQ